MLVALQVASRALVIPKLTWNARSFDLLLPGCGYCSLRSGGPAVDERRGQCRHGLHQMKQNQFSEIKTKPDATDRNVSLQQMLITEKR